VKETNNRKNLKQDFISHSASMMELKFIFEEALVGKLDGKTLVDIGSRLGCVLFAVPSLRFSFFLW